MKVFLLTVVGHVAAGLLIAWVDARFRCPPSAAGNTARAYPKQQLLRAAAMVVAIAWASILAFIVALAAILVLAAFDVPVSALPFVIPMFVTLVMAIIYLGLAFRIRCRVCANHVLIQKTTQPPFQETRQGFDGWATIVLRVLRRQPFRCMYCGQRYVP